MELPRHPLTFIVRLTRDDGGVLDGVVERVRTGRNGAYAARCSPKSSPRWLTRSRRRCDAAAVCDRALATARAQPAPNMTAAAQGDCSGGGAPRPRRGRPARCRRLALIAALAAAGPPRRRTRRHDDPPRRRPLSTRTRDQTFLRRAYRRRAPDNDLHPNERAAHTHQDSDRSSDERAAHVHPDADLDADDRAWGEQQRRSILKATTARDRPSSRAAARPAHLSRQG
jgi:hypothetical protein